MMETVKNVYKVTVFDKHWFSIYISIHLYEFRQILTNWAEFLALKNISLDTETIILGELESEVDETYFFYYTFILGKKISHIPSGLKTFLSSQQYVK